MIKYSMIITIMTILHSIIIYSIIMIIIYRAIIIIMVTHYHGDYYCIAYY